MDATVDGITIEQVPGAPWLVAYDLAAGHVAVAPARPAYISDELRAAWRDHLIASVNRRCHHCDCVASMSAMEKTAPRDGRGFVGRDSLPHDRDCPCSDERLEELERRDSPDGSIAPADVSDASADALIDYLQRITGRGCADDGP
jgi:hypothetical protein